MINLNSVTYYSLHHTHLLVAHVSVTDNQIIHKHQTQKKFFSSSPPQFPHTEIPSITDFSYIWCFLVFIIFLILPATESVLSVRQKIYQTWYKAYWELIWWEDMSMTTDVTGEVKTFLLSHGQVKHLMYIFVPSPKKGDVTKCTNNCTIALFPDANKILLRIIQKRLQMYTQNTGRQWNKQD